MTERKLEYSLLAYNICKKDRRRSLMEHNTCRKDRRQGTKPDETTLSYALEHAGRVTAGGCLARVLDVAPEVSKAFVSDGVRVKDPISLRADFPTSAKEDRAGTAD